jgi:hypothetical protein
MKKRLTTLVLSIFLAACAPSATATPVPDSTSTSPIATGIPAGELPAMPYAPQPNDANLSRENIFIEELGLLIRESYPPQVSLSISGNLPTPCHQLRAEVNAPDAENKINVNVYTVVDPNMLCTQVLKPFQENIGLETYPPGHYTVWANGELAGEFDT